MIRISIAESGKSPQLLTYNTSVITLGRTATHDLCLTGKGVSGTHCRIIREGGTYFIEDLGSTNGSYVNRQRVKGRQAIGPTDDVVLAIYRLRVLADNESGTSARPVSGPLPAASPTGGAMAATPGVRHHSPTAHVPAPSGAGYPGGPAMPAANPSMQGGYPAMQGSSPSAQGGYPAMPGATPSMPGANPAMQGGYPAMLGGTPSMPGVNPAMPGGTPSMPGVNPAMPGGTPSMPGVNPAMPGATPSMPGVNPAMPGGTPSMPGVNPAMPGATPSMPGAHPPIPGAMPSMPGSTPSMPGAGGALGPSGLPAGNSLNASGALDPVAVAWGREWEQIDKLATAWMVAGKDSGALLRGEKLAHARKWLSQGRGKRPAPTPVHRDFIMAGGRARSGRIFGRVFIGMLLLGGAAAGAWYLYGQDLGLEVEDDGEEVVVAATTDVGGGTAPKARSTGNRERSDELAQMAGGLFDSKPVLALLVAAEAITQLPRDRPALDAPAFAVLRGVLLAVPGRPLPGHGAAVEAVALSPDGRWAITAEAGRSGDVRLWDLFKDGVPEPKFLRGHPKGLTGMKVSPDGRWLVTADDDGLAMRWSLGDPDPSATGVRLEDHRAPITAIDTSTDGRWLATADEAGKVRVWDLERPLPDAIKLPKGPELAITDVAINGDGSRVIASSEDMIARNWRLTDGRPGRSPIQIPHEEVVVTTAALTDDDTWGVTGGADGVVRLWPPTSRAPTRKWELLEGHKGAINLLEVTADSSMAVSIARDNDLVVWDLKATVPAASSVRLEGHTDRIVTLDIYSPPAGVLNHVPTSAFTASADGTARSWNLDKRKSGVESRIFAGHNGAVRSVAVSGDGQWAITGGDDRVARVWDWQSLPLSGDLVETGSASLIGRGHTDGVVAVGVDDFGRRAVTGSADGTARVWDLRHPTRMLRLPIRELHEDRVRAVASSQRWAATGDDSGGLVIWDVLADRPKGLSLAGHTGEIGGVAFSPDAVRMVSVSTDRTARVWRINQDDPENDVTVLQHSDEVSHLAISGDGKWLLTGTLTAAALWDLEGPLTDAKHRFDEHEDDITSVALGPNGRWAATGSADRRVVLYDLSQTRPTTIKLRQHEDSIRVIAFDPKGRWLATGSDDKSIRLWDLRSEYPSEGSVALPGHQGWIMDLRWSADGNWLVSSSNDATIRLWDMRKDLEDRIDEAIVLEGHRAPVPQIDLIADEQGLAKIVSASYDGTTRLWPLRADDLVKLACTYAGRSFTEKEWKKYIGGDFDPACGR